MSAFERKQRIMAIRGLDLVHAQDQTGDGLLPYFQNVRCYQQGVAEARPGLTIVGAPFAGSRVHSLFRLTDATTGAAAPFTRLRGAGNQLFAGPTNGVAIDAGYSGNPLSFVAARPDLAVDAFAYVGDSQRQSKIDVSGNRTNWGSPGPLAPPTAVIAPPLYNFAATFDASTQDATTWQPINGGAVSKVFPISDIIQSIWYEDTVGKTGWCNVVPVTQNGGIPYRAGAQFAFLKPDNLTISEQAVIQEVKQQVPDTRIAAIAYDSGSSGPCSIAFDNLATATDVTTPTDLVNNLLILNFAEHVRVESATTGPDGTISIRTSTLGTYTAGQSVTGVFNFRVYARNTYTVSTLMQEAGALSVITGPAFIPQGGFQASLVQVSNHNLLNINGRPAQPDDLVHVTVNVRGLENLIEGRIWFDVDGTENDFSKNYYWFPFTTPYIQAALQQTFNANAAPSSLTSAIQTQVMDTNFNEQAPLMPAPTRSITTEPTAQTPTPQQTTFGDNQYAEIVFRVRDLIRFGSDASRNLANVAAMQVSLTLSGPVQLIIASIWVGGSYGPDVASIGAPYQYRYRARSSANGARTNPSPPMRSGVTPTRQAVNVTGAGHPDPQMDLLDIERFGGSLTTWQYVGTIPNANPWTYQDVYDDTDLASSVATERDAFQPYPTIDTPKNTVVNVAGTTVTRVSGDTFNTGWGEGTEVVINGLPTTLYAQPMSTDQFEIVDNLGALSGVPMQIQQATLLGQPMPSNWMHPDGWLMGCGCLQQPGTLFWTNRYNPDSTQDRYSLDLTDPSDPLVGGGVWDSRVFVFSRKQVFPLADDYASPQVFSTKGLPIGKGPVAPWCLAFGDAMAFVHEDGVFEFDGVELPVCITDDIAPLFHRDGSPGESILGIGAPDFTHPELMSLTWGAGCWWFDYQDTDGNRQSLFYHRALKGWWQDIYTPDVSIHYQEIDDEIDTILIGGNDGSLYQMSILDPESSETDNGATIYCVIRTRCDDNEDTRLNKLFGDGMVDLATNGVPVYVQPGYDVFKNQLSSTVIPGTPIQDRYQVPIDINSGNGVTSPTFGVTICFTPGPQIFSWGWTLVPKVETTAMRATDWENAGVNGAKFVQGILIRADTVGVDKTVRIEYDQDGQITPDLVVNDTGETMTAYSFNPPVVAHLLRVNPIDTVAWRLLDYQYIFEPAPEQVLNWQTQPTTFDSPGFKHCYLIGLAHVSTQDITLVVAVDGNNFSYTIANSGGIYAKTFLVLQAIKGKAFSFGLASPAPFQIFARDTEVRWMPWNAQTEYQIATPFGGPSRAVGAQI